MEAIIIELENNLAAEDSFLMKIRNLEGFDRDKFSELLSMLERIRQFYIDSTVVPKQLALMLVNLEPILWVMCESYEQPVKDEIIAAAAEISEAVSSCLQ